MDDGIEVNDGEHKRYDRESNNKAGGLWNQRTWVESNVEKAFGQYGVDEIGIK